MSNLRSYPMFHHTADDVQTKAINKIVAKYINQAKASNKETAFTDMDRKGMDAVIKYCAEQGLPTLGHHVVDAQIQFMQAAE